MELIPSTDRFDHGALERDEEEGFVTLKSLLGEACFDSDYGYDGAHIHKTVARRGVSLRQPMSKSRSPEVIVSGGNVAGSKRVDLEAETYDAQISNRNSSRPIPPSGAEHEAEAVRRVAELAPRHTRTKSRKPITSNQHSKRTKTHRRALGTLQRDLPKAWLCHISPITKRTRTDRNSQLPQSRNSAASRQFEARRRIIEKNS